MQWNIYKKELAPYKGENSRRDKVIKKIGADEYLKRLIKWRKDIADRHYCVRD